MKRGIAGLLAGLLLALAGCGTKEEKRITDFTGMEAENAVGNWNAHGAAFAETENYVYFCVNMHYYRMSKATGQVVLNCDAPDCKHDSVLCSAYMGYVTSVHVFQDKLYFVDNYSPEIFFRLDEGEKTEYLRLDREVGGGANHEYSENRINRDRLYAFHSYNKGSERTEEMTVTDLATGKEVAAFPDTSSFQQGFLIQDDTIYYITMDLELYAMDLDGENRRLIEGDRATRLTSDGERLYFIHIQNDNPTLYSMDKEGGDRRLLMDNMMDYNILGDRIFYTKLHEDGLFVINKDGGKPRLLTEEKVSDIGVFPRWDKVIVLPFYENDHILLMDGDGSNLQSIDIPESY